MGTEDKKRQFDEIVARLTADYPSLGRSRGLRWSRAALIAGAVLGAVVWGLLSVAMVAWGARGVVLTCSVVVATVIGLVVDSHRPRR